MTLNQTEVALITAKIIIVSEPINIFWNSLALAILFMSSYKFDKKKLFGYGGAFWVCITLSYCLSLSVRVATYILGVHVNVLVIKLVGTLAVSLSEFAFSTVILALKSLNNMFLLKDNKTEKIWLAFNAIQIPINIVIVTIQVVTLQNTENIYWNNLFISSTQFINLVVFVYFYETMRRDIQKASLSQETFALITKIMTRFVDFSFAYLIYVTLCFFGCVVTIFELADYQSDSILSLYGIYLLGSVPAEFYVLLCSLYLFAPYWYLLATKVTINNIELGVQNPNPGAQRLSNQMNEMLCNSRVISNNNNSSCGIGKRKNTLLDTVPSKIIVQSENIPKRLSQLHSDILPPSTNTHHVCCTCGHKKSEIKLYNSCVIDTTTTHESHESPSTCTMTFEENGPSDANTATESPSPWESNKRSDFVG